MSFKILIYFCLIWGIITLPLPGADTKKILKFYSGNNSILSIEIADTPEKRNRGLMFRKHLPEDSGMLFVFEKSEILNFWMKNTYIPLSIAFIDEDCFLREMYDMKPLDTSLTYPSKQNMKYALEVNRGWFSRKGIKTGDRIDYSGCIGK